MWRCTGCGGTKVVGLRNAMGCGGTCCLRASSPWRAPPASNSRRAFSSSPAGPAHTQPTESVPTTPSLGALASPHGISPRCLPTVSPHCIFPWNLPTASPLVPPTVSVRVRFLPIQDGGCEPQHRAPERGSHQFPRRAVTAGARAVNLVASHAGAQAGAVLAHEVALRNGIRGSRRTHSRHATGAGRRLRPGRRGRLGGTTAHVCGCGTQGRAKQQALDGL